MHEYQQGRSAFPQLGTVRPLELASLAECGAERRPIRLATRRSMNSEYDRLGRTIAVRQADAGGCCRCSGAFHHAERDDYGIVMPTAF